MYKWPEYWLEKIQNDIYRAAVEFMKQKGLNQNGLAQHLGVTKGYVSQILNGNFNFSISNLVKLSLALGVAPDLDLSKSLEEYAEKEELRLERLQQGFTAALSPKAIYSLNPENAINGNAA